MECIPISVTFERLETVLQRETAGETAGPQEIHAECPMKWDSGHQTCQAIRSAYGSWSNLVSRQMDASAAIFVAASDAVTSN
jgi:hypothetical protein